ncbi:unnamed protein product [Symbiodinium sp. CCMP2592]|nr:unnamed protein product [Symbiodinium sp. CCMP2592]
MDPNSPVSAPGLFEGRCVPEPASSANWSLSAHCSDKNFVVGRAARINGLNASTSAAVGMLAVIFSSPAWLALFQA